ncbi:NAD(P)-binding protein [Lindgomyces ingoldianus]|uniref:NAD(P)-binding protein n=1 Tax=Lindgomyces ingoldianus TaxID=673940 RepID=A0ACB6QPN1_9PLEO|nr:NAD(P)-binding protein [Lindgomyces ingoldianus]KAF2468939.1 NAD(P)-binding protein [Lindgomyces ingoldianus]
MATGIALIGSGIFAKEEHLPAIQGTPLLALKAIYSRSLASAMGLSEGLDGVDLYSEDSEEKNFDELLKRNDIKGVVIALPILIQPEFIKKALSAGKHVLAEKPIAKDVATATELISWYNSTITQTPRPTFTVAENFRFLESYTFASQQIATIGRVLGFRTRVSSMVQPGGKYFETAWRKTPEYQGGFLLDGGVHFIAATRLMLGEDHRPVKASAFTAQLQPHLPPVDTLNATLLLKSGASGTLSLSFGTTFTGSEYAVACEKGTVYVSRGKVIVTKDGKEEVKEFLEEGNGVKQEIKGWAEALGTGGMDQRQAPEEALADLKLLEACLRSGEYGGMPMEI